MTKSSTSIGERLDVYAAITDQIVTAIEAGADNPNMPWHCAGSVNERPINVASGEGYRGVNTVALWASAFSQQFPTGLWGTYRQWQAKGAQVRKGEKSSLIVFYKELAAPGADDDGDHGHAGGDDDHRQRSRFMARASRVFNITQVDGYEVPAVDTAIDPVAPCGRAELLVSATGARVIEGGISAHYDRRADHIAMPDRFTGTKTTTATGGWYSTLLHELTHWSGAEHRMARVFSERFGDDAYATEEMVAELGAAFLCGDLGITVEPRPDHADYIGHWLRILKGDRNAIFTAASAANKAAEFLIGFERRELREAARRPARLSQ